MNDDVSDRIVAVEIRAAKASTVELLKAIQKALAKLESGLYRAAIRSGRSAHKGSHGPGSKDGKQSLKSLKAQGVQLSNIEITNENIKSFERYARKYKIDFALKKDVNAEPPRFFVFFRAKDMNQVKAAFKEFSGAMLKRNKARGAGAMAMDDAPVSVVEELKKAVAMAQKEAARTKMKVQVHER